MSGLISRRYCYRLLCHIFAARFEHRLAVVAGSGVGPLEYLLLINRRCGFAGRIRLPPDHHPVCSNRKARRGVPGDPKVSSPEKFWDQ